LNQQRQSKLAIKKRPDNIEVSRSSEDENEFGGFKVIKPMRKGGEFRDHPIIPYDSSSDSRRI